MNRTDPLQAKIEKALMELLGGTSKKSDEEQKELRSNVLLAIKWQAVKLKMNEDDWGSGFKNGKDLENESESEDE